ncbi:MAG: porphobilinogen synthase [Planctomycetota bacterium]
MTPMGDANPPAAGLGRYPTTRLRRLRRHAWSRALVAEQTLTVDDLIWPLFVHDRDTPADIPTMPGVHRLSIPGVVDAARRAVDLGIPAIAVFPAPDPSLKTDDGREAVNPDNLVCRTLRALRDAGLVGKLGLFTDVALDPYTDHGHDGLLRGDAIVNDPTVEVLCRQAVNQAKAGCDVIAPSDMMDGRVAMIRQALDAEGFEDVAIMSYAAKYASAFYGPFRDAVGSQAALRGDKRTYQMDPANGDEALREAALDVAEGADALIVKPGLPYLDVCWRVKAALGVPTFAYQVSGEYAMLDAAARAGAIDRRRAVVESLLAFKRAGCDGVWTYFAAEAASWLASGGP